MNSPLTLYLSKVRAYESDVRKRKKDSDPKAITSKMKLELQRMTSLGFGQRPCGFYESNSGAERTGGFCCEPTGLRPLRNIQRTQERPYALLTAILPFLCPSYGGKSNPPPCFAQVTKEKAIPRLAPAFIQQNIRDRNLRPLHLAKIWPDVE